MARGLALLAYYCTLRLGRQLMSTSTYKAA